MNINIIHLLLIIVSVLAIMKIVRTEDYDPFLGTSKLTTVKYVLMVIASFFLISLLLRATDTAKEDTKEREQELLSISNQGFTHIVEWEEKKEYIKDYSIIDGCVRGVFYLSETEVVCGSFALKKFILENENKK